VADGGIVILVHRFGRVFPRPTQQPYHVFFRAAPIARDPELLAAERGRLDVVYVDELEERGYVERRRNPDDRRLHALYLTAAGKRLMRKLSELARQHELGLTAALDTEQYSTLRGLLATVAQQQGLTPHVHPGYRTLLRPARPAG